MAECLTPEEIERYRRGTLGAAEAWSAADTHLAGCARCSEALHAALSPARASAARHLTPAAGDTACLEEDLLRRYVFGEADEIERSLVEAHLEDCLLCAEDVATLRTFQAQMQTYDWEEARTAAREPARGRGWREWFSWTALRPALLPVGSAAVFATVAVLIVSLIWQARFDTLKRQVGDDEQQRASEISALQKQVERLNQENRRLQHDYHVAQAALKLANERLATLQEQPSFKSLRPALNDAGGQIGLDAKGEVVGLESASPDIKQKAKRALTRQQLARADDLDRYGLTGLPPNLRGGPGEEKSFVLIRPNRTVVRSDRPTFQWKPLKGAKTYKVTVMDRGSDQSVATSDPLTETTWTPTRPLPRGRVYHWKVEATLEDGTPVQSPPPPSSDGPPTQKMKFKVLEQAPWERLERVEQQYAGSHLIRGLLYAEAGLLEDAEQELKALLEANPQSIVARNLLKSVDALRKPKE